MSLPDDKIGLHSTSKYMVTIYSIAHIQKVRKTWFYLGGIRLLHDHIWLAALAYVSLLKDFLQLQFMRRVRTLLSIY